MLLRQQHNRYPRWVIGPTRSFLIGILLCCGWVCVFMSSSVMGNDDNHNHKYNPQIGWKLDDFVTAAVTTSSYDRIANVNDILSVEDMEQLELQIQAFESSKAVTEFSLLHSSIKDQNQNQNHHDESQHHQQQPGGQIQLAVAVVEKMNLGSLEEDWAAETFATTLHDTWGVGYDTSMGGTGIVIFLSIQDRVVYISRGSAISSIVTDTRVDRLIETIKPTLQQTQYRQAIEMALDILTQYLQDGPPEGWEYWKDEILLPYGVPACIVGLITSIALISRKRNRDQQREYAAVSSQLSQLDRAQAQALQGQYQATSCPICLEDFVVAPIPNTTTATANQQQEDEKEEAEGVGDNKNESEADMPTPSSNPPPQSQADEQQQLIGSDGQPVKLLRCGHVFDESCWAEWVSSGTGDVTKCPICQKDVGSGSSSSSGSTHNNNNRQAQPPHRRGQGGNQNGPPEDVQPGQDQHHRGGNDNDADDDFVYDRHNERNVIDHHNNGNHQLAQFRRERNFRLVRLAQRFPQYIRQNEIQRWTESTYDGSLVRDPSFVQSNPRLQQGSGAGASSSRGQQGGWGAGGGSRPSFSSFGGGSSSGGRGGRW